MASEQKSDHDQLDRQRYEPLDDPRNWVALLDTIKRLMQAARDGQYDSDGDDLERARFCDLVDDDEIWSSATDVVVEFRSEHGSGQGHGDAMVHQLPNKGLQDILQRLANRLAPGIGGCNFLNERAMLKSRLRAWVEYVMTGGQGRHVATDNNADQGHGQEGGDGVGSSLDSMVEQANEVVEGRR